MLPIQYRIKSLFDKTPHKGQPPNSGQWFIVVLALFKIIVTLIIVINCTNKLINTVEPPNKGQTGALSLC